MNIMNTWKPWPLLMMIGLLGCSGEAMAKLTDAQAVNKAGQQRMLSQRIARSFLMGGLDVNARAAQEELVKSKADFEQNLKDLEEYAGQKEVKDDLARVRESWQSYQALSSTAPSPASAVEVVRAGDAVLQRSESLALKILRFVPVQPGKQVSLSGRQRMLSQRIAVYYLARHWKLPLPGIDATLGGAVQEYEKGAALLEDDRVNTPKINAELLKMRAQWRFARSALDQYKEGHSAPVVIIRTMDSILKQMDEITGLYVQLQGS